jgi:hypothetical protein
MYRVSLMTALGRSFRIREALLLAKKNHHRP